MRVLRFQVSRPQDWTRAASDQERPDRLYQYSTHSAYAGGTVLDGPKVSFLNGYGDYAYCLTPNGRPIVLVNSKSVHLRRKQQSQRNITPTHHWHSR